MFWSIKNSGEVLNKLKSRGFRATSLSTYDFSTLYTTLPHDLIKEKLINLIEWTFKREGSPYIACNERQAFFTSGDTQRYKLWSCQNVCEALIYLLDNIYLLGPPGFNCWFSFAPVFQWCCSTPQGSPGVGHNTLFLSSPHLCFIIVFICDLFVSRDDPLMG